MKKVMMIIAGLSMVGLCAGTVIADEIKTETLSTPIKVTYTLPNQGAVEDITFSKINKNVDKYVGKLSTIETIPAGGWITIIRREGAESSNGQEMVSSVAYPMKLNFVTR